VPAHFCAGRYSDVHVEVVAPVDLVRDARSVRFVETIRLDCTKQIGRLGPLIVSSTRAQKPTSKSELTPMARALEKIVLKKVGPGAIRDQLGLFSQAWWDDPNRLRAAAGQLVDEINFFDDELSKLYEIIRQKKTSGFAHLRGG